MLKKILVWTFPSLLLEFIYLYLIFLFLMKQQWGWVLGFPQVTCMQLKWLKSGILLCIFWSWLIPHATVWFSTRASTLVYGVFRHPSSKFSQLLTRASEPMLSRDPLEHFLVNDSVSKHTGAVLPITCGLPVPESTIDTYTLHLISS